MGEGEEKYIIRSFIVFTVYQILLGGAGLAWSIHEKDMKCMFIFWVGDLA
jgi:hypothetical protein